MAPVLLTPARNLARSAVFLIGMMLCSAGTASADVFTFTNNTPGAINSGSTIDRVINVPDHLTITDVNVIIGSLTHTFTGDIDMFLAGPDGVFRDLSTDNGGGGDNYINTVFDQSAATSITTASAPFTGSFRPEFDLNVFNGTDPFGNWTLRIFDDTFGDNGQFNSWSLEIHSATVTAIPEPSYLIVLPLGVAIVMLRRRQALR